MPRCVCNNKKLHLRPILDLLAAYDSSAQIAAIEDMIAQDASPQIVLRLMCLASLLNGGIKGKTLENLKREFLQVRQAPIPRELHSTLCVDIRIRVLTIAPKSCFAVVVTLSTHSP